MPDESSESHPPPEIAWVLFTDIVGFSLNPSEKQKELLLTLQQIVRATEQFKRAQAAGNLISLPTGDGMALAFFGDPVAPVKCAIEIQTALHSHPELPLRTAVHTGPVFRHSDIQDNINIVGSGINMAQRVMDCGEAGHILVSQSVAEVLAQLTGWPAYLHDLGRHRVKHGARMHLFNLVGPGFGNNTRPEKLGASSNTKVIVVLGVTLIIAAGGVATWKYFEKAAEPPRRKVVNPYDLMVGPRVQPQTDSQTVREPPHSVPEVPPTWETIESRIRTELVNESIVRVDKLRELSYTANADRTTGTWDWNWGQTRSSTEGSFCRQLVEVMEEGGNGNRKSVTMAVIYRLDKHSWTFWKLIPRPVETTSQ